MKNITVHCPTQEIADQVIEKALRKGLKFAFGPTPSEKNHWPYAKEKTYYTLEHGFLVVGDSDLMDSGKDFIHGHDYLKYDYP